jgi:beta-N-acetylhexosaminidase
MSKKPRNILAFILAIIVLVFIITVAISIRSHRGDSSVQSGNGENGDTAAMSEATEQDTIASEEDLPDAKLDNLLRAMTLEEKIYQLFVVTPEQLTGEETVTAADDTTKDRLEQYPVGGIIYFSANLVSTDQTKEMLGQIQEFSYEIEGLPLFLCVDEEGGRVARIANNPSFGVEQVGPMADIASAEEAYQCGNTIGNYLYELGFNVDFAPDADVITNENNTVIGDRSFGSDSAVVTEYAIAYSDGLHNNQILSTFKHFPGHGATEADTHEGYAYTNKSYEELSEAELKPFEAAGENGVDMIMVAHISLPTILGEDTPCSLSKEMVTDILREELGYQGIVITDALNMGAISEKYDSSTAAVKAIEAGVDLLLTPVDLEAAYAGIYAAVCNGEISENRIDESVRRILKAKLAMGREG